MSTAAIGPNGSGRPLPHSLEAEEFLLSCCFLDGADVIGRCVEAQIGPASFYDPKHSVIYERLLDLYNRKEPIDIAILAEELKTSRQLDAIGGYAFLAQVSSRVPTTLQTATWIEKVRELSLLREIIRSATGAVEDCYNFSGDIDGFVESLEKRMHWNDRSSAQSLLAKLESSRYDPRRRLPDVAPVFSLGKVPICTRGNLSTITAQSKSGKSSFLAGMMAASFLDPDHGGDTFTARGLNTAGRALIAFDTEQHGKHHERMMDVTMHRAGASVLPPWLHSYSRKGATPSELRHELEVLTKVKSKAHGGIFAILLDGIADFVLDVNDARECNELVTWLEKLAVEHETVIVCVLHLNPVANRDSVLKARGHLGSQLQRKVETDIRLKKDADDITTVFTDPQGTRGEPVFEKDGPRFKWDHEAGMHTSVSTTKQETRDGEKAARLREIAEDVWGEDRALRYSEIIPRIKATCRIKDSGAEEKFTDMKRAGVIIKQIHLWRIAA